MTELGHFIAFMAVTLYVCASAVVCMGVIVPMDPDDQRVAARLVGSLYLLATCLLMTGLALLATSR